MIWLQGCGGIKDTIRVVNGYPVTAGIGLRLVRHQPVQGDGELAGLQTILVTGITAGDLAAWSLANTLYLEQSFDKEFDQKILGLLIVIGKLAQGASEVMVACIGYRLILDLVPVQVPGCLAILENDVVITCAKFLVDLADIRDAGPLDDPAGWEVVGQ